MKHFVRLMAIFIATGSLAACVTTRIPPERLQSIRTVAVVSDFDDEIHQFFYGLLAFDTEHHTAGVDAWHINEHVLSTASKVLAHQYRLVPGGKVDRSGYTINKWTDDAAQRGEKIYASIVGRNPDADAYLLFVPDTNVSIAATASWPVDNIGLIRASLSMRMPWAKYHQYAVYAAYNLFLMDARTGKLIAFTPAEPLKNSTGSTMYKLPNAYIETSDDWPKTLPEVLKDYGPEVERRMKEMLTRSVHQTLQDAGLLEKP